jgi:hypothetical protein
MTPHKIRYQRVGLKIERVADADRERVALAPDPATQEAPPPLPLRPVTLAPPPPPTYHERVLAVVTPPRTHAGGRPRLESRVSGAQLRRARTLAGVPQRVLAEQRACSRSAVAEAERGRRPVLPPVAAWVESVLRDHGEWDDGDSGEPEEGAAP